MKTNARAFLMVIASLAGNVASAQEDGPDLAHADTSIPQDESGHNRPLFLVLRVCSSRRAADRADAPGRAFFKILSRHR